MSKPAADPIADAYMRRYGERIYNPSANAIALEEKAAASARKARLAALHGAKPKRDCE
jgi:hypothetical protein